MLKAGQEARQAAYRVALWQRCQSSSSSRAVLAWRCPHQQQRWSSTWVDNQWVSAGLLVIQIVLTVNQLSVLHAAGGMSILGRNQT